MENIYEGKYNAGKANKETFTRSYNGMVSEIIISVSLVLEWTNGKI